MAYITVAVVASRISERELIRLTDEKGLGVVVESVVDVAIETAEIEVDAYLGSRYSLPLDPVPAIATKLCCDLAIYNLYVNSPSGVPEDRQTQASTARAMLEKIAAGKLDIMPTHAPADGEDATSDEFVIEGPARVFSRDKMGGF